MQVLQAWLLFPALLALLSLGWGLLVERLSGARLPGVLLLPVGFAAVIVVTRAAMWLDITAELATPLVVVGRGRGPRARPGAASRSPRLDRWAAGAALVVFAVFAAPDRAERRRPRSPATRSSATRPSTSCSSTGSPRTAPTWPGSRPRRTGRRSRRTSPAAIRWARTPRSAPCGRSPSSTWPGRSSRSSPSWRRCSR